MTTPWHSFWALLRIKPWLGVVILLWLALVVSFVMFLVLVVRALLK